MFALSGNVVSPAALPPLDALPPGVPGPVQPFFGPGEDQGRGQNIARGPLEAQVL